MTPPPPTRQVRTRTVPYVADAAALLAALAGDGLVATTGSVTGAGTSTVRPVDTILLESVDIATKVSRTTIAVLEAGARLTCNGRDVAVEALPQARADGQAAIALLREHLGDYIVPAGTGTPRESGEPGPAHAARPAGSGSDRLTLRFPAAPAGLEERERLTAPSPTDALRVLAEARIDHPHLPLEAGVVAFDFLATFEDLPEVSMGANTCPDYLFYDARILLVVDHPTRSATLVAASVDVADLEARLAELADTVASFSRALASPEADSARAAAGQPGAPGAPGGPDAPDGPSASAGSAAPASQPAVPATRPVLRAVPTQSDADFATQVTALKEAIEAGEIYQVVPSRGFTLPCPDAMAAYGQLRRANPSPYMFYLAAPDFELLGASPESALLHSAATGQVAIRPIAGTQPRGYATGPDGAEYLDHELDTRLELELRTDAKEVAEHVMLVDLARNDVARVSVPGTRRVRDLLRVDRYSRVMHLVSEVCGQLAPDLHPLDAFRASMTMGTLTGAPKLRAAELIRQAEGVRRGSYGGSVGYLRGDGELDTCIVIRSAFVTGGTALVQAGAGVVGASDPAAEAAETVHKASAVLRAVAAAQGAELVIDTESARQPAPPGPRSHRDEASGRATASGGVGTDEAGDQPAAVTGVEA